MGQSKAAALRKTGLRARIYFCVSGIIAAGYVWFYSLENILISYKAFEGLFVHEGLYFTLDGRQILQETALLYAALCFAWYVLVGSRYSPVKRASFLPKLNGLSLFLIGIYYACLLDFEALRTVNEENDYPLILLVIFFFPLMALLGGLSDKLFPFIPKVFFYLLLPVLFLCAPLADLLDGLIVWWVFKVVFVPLLIFTLPVYWLASFEYVKEHPEYRKLFVFGRGGAARWGGIYSFLKYDFNAFMAGSEHRSAPIYLGQSLWYDDIKLGGRHIGLDSDSMMLTVAAMGGGKSLYSAWNTLLCWGGGVFALDPKGEHFQRTYAQRESGGRKTHLIDPWDQCGHTPKEKAGFNPLEEIDITSPNAKDDIGQIVESCILQDSSENANSKHFRENAQKIMIGVIAHVLSTSPKEHHNLPTVYDIILTGAPDGVASDPQAFNRLVDRMAINEAMGRAPMDAAKVLKEAGENERGGFITTLAMGLSWVNTPVLRPILMRSTFRMRDIKVKRDSVYMVIPFEHMNAHSRLLRTVVSMGLMSCREPADHSYKTLFLLDEFPQLGTFRPIKEGLVTLRSRDVKIWMHLQNLGQLKERYNNWQDFMSSCDKQFFAVNDYTTAEEISKMLGDYVERWIEGKVGETRYIDKNRPLRSPSEVQEELKKGSGLQYVLPADGLPLKLKLVPFYKNFRQYGAVKGNRFG